ncbi:MAG: hypothetical protein HC802_04505 [Caldilineaceae bacterium]|nr:hypothetical protein [Caldilineaceae bacterium]
MNGVVAAYSVWCGVLAGCCRRSVYLPVLLGLRTFPDGDFTHHFLPFSLFQQHELLALRLPVWNPFTYSGHPFLADTQAALFYPLSNLLLFATLPWTDPAARLYFLQLEAIVQIALAGFFVFLLVRELTGVWHAGLLAGAIFALSGYLTGYPPVQLAVLRTAIWLPLLLWLLLRAMLEPGRWRFWIGAVVCASVMVLAGHPQTLLHAAYATIAWVIFLLWQAPKTSIQTNAQTTTRVIGWLVCGLAIVGLSAVQLLPSLEFAQYSVRANVEYAFVSGGFPLQDTWQLLLPGVLTVYSPLYVGVVALGLVALALSRLRRGQPSPDAPKLGKGTLALRPAVAFFLALAVIALLLSYGENGFLYSLFYRLAPGWDRFRGQERAAYLVTLSLCVLSGYGVALLTQLTLGQRRRIALIYAAVVTIGVYAFGLIWQLPGRSAISQWSYLGVAFVTLTLAMGFVLLLWLPGWSRRRWIILATLAIGNLFWANFSTNLGDYGPVRKTLLAPEMVALEEAVAARADANLGLPGRVYNEARIYDDYGMRQSMRGCLGGAARCGWRPMRRSSTTSRWTACGV